jgi:hypothetical protein
VRRLTAPTVISTSRNAQLQRRHSPRAKRGPLHAIGALCAHEGNLWRCPHPQACTQQNRPRANDIGGSPRLAGRRADVDCSEDAKPAQHGPTHRIEVLDRVDQQAESHGGECVQHQHRRRQQPAGVLVVAGDSQHHVAQDLSRGQRANHQHSARMSALERDSTDYRANRRAHHQQEDQRTARRGAATGTGMRCRGHQRRAHADQSAVHIPRTGSRRAHPRNLTDAATTSVSRPRAPQRGAS